MIYERELSILEKYIRDNNLKQSGTRVKILETFLKAGKHLTVEELHELVKREYPEIGSATVYRTMGLLYECGLCRELYLEDGKTRYEPLFGHEHHDHLICVKCGKFVEVVSDEIERLQEKLAKEHDFLLQQHRLILYGVCGECARK